MNYVLGFYFEKDRVLLIKKNRPEWQKGNWNGIGGKIVEEGEDGRVAMSREFLEETGCAVDSLLWRYCAYISDHRHSMQVFSLQEPKTVTDESVGFFSVLNLPSNIIPNLQWMIPLLREPNAKFPLRLPYNLTGER